MTDTGHPHHETGAPPATEPTPPASHQGGHQMDGRMMWVMMIGCCLAVPLAFIVFGASLAGLAGASPWLIGVAVVLAVALLITRRVSNAPRRDTSPDSHE